MTGNENKDKAIEFKEKQDDLLAEMGVIKNGMFEAGHVDDADVVLCTMKHIEALYDDLEKCGQYNTTLAVTNKALIGEINNKAKNLLSFHTASILQGLLAYNGTTTRSGKGLIDDSMVLAKEIIEKITKETNKDEN